MLGELGTVGALAFIVLIISIGLSVRKLMKQIKVNEAQPRLVPLYHLVQAIGISTALLLLMGLFGHNLYRYNYVWYAAFLSVLVRSYRPQPQEEFTYQGGSAWTPAWA